MIGMERLGQRFDRLVTKALAPVVTKMAKHPLTAFVAIEAAMTAGLLAQKAGVKSWTPGSALRAAAEQAQGEDGDGFRKCVEIAGFRAAVSVRNEAAVPAQAISSDKEILARFKAEGVLSYFYHAGVEAANLVKLSVNELKLLLGGKGFGLYIMRSRLGIRTPAIFTIPTWVSNDLVGGKLQPRHLDQLRKDVSQLEMETGKKLGDRDNPLTVSARSGAFRSMPGMMDTILNIGLNDDIVVRQIRLHPEQEWLWLDNYRRLLQMFGDVTLEMGKEPFEKALHDVKEKYKVKKASELSAVALKELISDFKAIYSKNEKELPKDAFEQLAMCVEAVFRSWQNPRAIFTRKEDGIADYYGTAVNVQEMVFGNKGQNSGTGVMMTRNNKTGVKEPGVLYGSITYQGQGEDVVAGDDSGHPIESLKTHSDPRMRRIYDELREYGDRLEKYHKDMQDTEFTIEQDNEGNPVLYMLQTRNGKRSAQALVRVAVDLANEGLITREEAVMSVAPERLNELLHPQFTDKGLKAATSLGKGTGASNGAAVGAVVFSAEEAIKAAAAGQKVILVTVMTSQDDIEGMKRAEGVLTSIGSKVSHAAIMCTGWGKPCIVGASEIEFVREGEQIVAFKLGDRTVKKGDVISLDGNTGKIYDGKVERVFPKELDESAKTLLDWADGIRRMEVRANAELPDAQQAFDFGARGVGLLRTEHTFSDVNDLRLIQEYFLRGRSETAIRTSLLEKLAVHYEHEFEGVLRINDGEGVTVRLLDAPVHEFMPNKARDVEAVAAILGLPLPEVQDRIEKVKEENPMLGFRSVRFGMVNPDFYSMQVRSLLQASAKLIKEGKDPRPEIEIPLVIKIGEIKAMKQMVEDVVAEVEQREGIKIPYRFGVMIETPAAALQGKEIATLLGPDGFVSWGTNDETQTTLAISRDDADAFLPGYVEKGIVERHPFQHLDPLVEKLIGIFMSDARSVHPNFAVFVCGEHGGDPYSIGRFEANGFTGVSMSPFNVPAARLAAAQAVLAEKALEKKLTPKPVVLPEANRWPL